MAAAACNLVAGEALIGDNPRAAAGSETLAERRSELAVRGSLTPHGRLTEGLHEWLPRRVIWLPARY